MTATQTKWAERVQAWRASGKTAEEYANAFECQSSTLRYWASRLKTASAGEAHGGWCGWFAEHRVRWSRNPAARVLPREGYEW